MTTMTTPIPAPAEGTPSQIPADAHESIRRQLTKHVVLASPSVGNPVANGFNYQIGNRSTNRNGQQTSNVAIQIDGRSVDTAHVTMPQVKLFDCCDELKHIRKEFRKLDNKIKCLIDGQSVAPCAGIRAFPVSVFPTVMDELLGPADKNGNARPKLGSDGNPLSMDQQSLLYQLSRYGHRLRERWPAILQLMERHIEPHIWSAVRHKVPTAASLAKRFYIHIFPVYLQVGNDVKIGRDEVEDHAAHFRSAIERRMEDTIEAMIAEPRQMLADSLTNLYELIKKDGRVTAKSFKPVHAAISKIRLFKFMANSTMIDQITKMEQKLHSMDPSALDSVTAGTNGLFAAIESLQQEVVDAEKQAADFERFGRAGRSLAL